MSTIAEFTKKDLLKAIYFILCKFSLDALHHQGTSSKRDLIGGFIDRWINRISEHAVFNKLLEEKSYKVVSDFFLYSSDSEKNAPDILGLVDNAGNPLSVFSKYTDGAWIQERGMPFIEVKVFRKDQKLISVRESQMNDDHFYAFIESNIAEDYLSILFEEDLFSEKIMESLKMDQAFINSDNENQLLDPVTINRPKSIGNFKLMGIYKGSELKKHSVKLEKKQGIYYLKTVEPPKTLPKTSIDEILGSEQDIFKYNDGYLPLYLKTDDEVEIIKRNKGNCYLKSYGTLTVNEHNLKPGIHKLIFTEFQRTSNWEEYVGYKNTFDNEKNKDFAIKPEDSTEHLLSLFDKLVNSSE